MRTQVKQDHACYGVSVLSPPSFLMPSCQIIGRPVTGECPESHGVCSLPISPEVPSGQNGSDVWNPAFLHCFRLSCKRTVSPAFHQRPHCRRSAKGKTEAPCVTSEVSSRLAKAGGTDTLAVGARGARSRWEEARDLVFAAGESPRSVPASRGSCPGRRMRPPSGLPRRGRETPHGHEDRAWASGCCRNPRVPVWPVVEADGPASSSSRRTSPDLEGALWENSEKREAVRGCPVRRGSKFACIVGDETIDIHRI